MFPVYFIQVSPACTCWPSSVGLLLGSFSDLNQLPANYLSLGENALNAQVPNPFYGFITSGNLPGENNSAV